MHICLHSTSLAIKTCTLSSNGNSIDFIENGLVPSYFTQMVVPLNSTLNREAKFNWKVFQVGNLATSTLSCKIELITDYCLSGDFQCEENSSCSKTVDGYACICNEGFEKSNNGSLCTDINECLVGEFQCEENSFCNNTIGNYSCVCNDGYERNDEESSCTDINECLTGEFQCEENSFCNNTIGNYSCICNDGFERSEEEGSCTDVDECLRTCIIRSFLEV